MADVPAHLTERLTTRRDQPLIGVPIRQGADEVVQYFTSEAEADRALAHESADIERVPRLIGAWEHIDAEEGPDMLEELDRLRHESKPSPPLEL